METKYLETVNHLYIRDLNERGQGVGTDEDRFVWFVDGALPGETVDATVKSRKKRFGKAVLRRILIASADRIDPFCPLAAHCGGCQLQHLSYIAQLNWKEKRVTRLLEQIGGLDYFSKVMHPIAGMARPFHYRNKVSLPIGGTIKCPEIGFYAPESRDIVDGKVCLVQPKAAGALREKLRQLIMEKGIAPYDEKRHTGLLRHMIVRTSEDGSQVMVILVTAEDSPIFDGQLAETLAAELWLSSGERLSSLYININRDKTAEIAGPVYRHVWGDRYLEMTMNNLTFRLMPQAFFQVNICQAEKLFAELTNLSVQYFPEEKPSALDLYGGTGAIALHLAREGFPVTGVDITPASVSDARANALRNGLKADFVAADAVEYATVRLDRGDIGLLILDPPRRGVEEKLLQKITEQAKTGQAIPEIIIYVSCNPATLARDLSILKKNYSVRYVHPYDFFPWTTHVETIMLLFRAES
jgi:23S rRNA (uracil1939-C5)-methyltransferase